MAKYCFYCNKQVFKRPSIKGRPTPHDTLTQDHTTPKLRGGSCSPKVTCCEGCNQDKGQLTLDEYRVVVAYRASLIQSDYKFPGEVDSGS